MHSVGRGLLDARKDVTCDFVVEPDKYRLNKGIETADALILRLTPLTANTIAKARQLKVVSRYGVGYDHVDVDALTAKGIPLAIVGDALSTAVAEHTLLLMLAASRQTPVMDRLTRTGGYGERFTRHYNDLLGRTLLLIGFGKIGRETATRCAAFGMNIIVAARSNKRADIERAGYRHVEDFHEALGEADYVSLHIPGMPDQSAVIGPAEFRQMKPGAYLINTARGSLIDEDALHVALTKGTLRGAGLDVTRQEPPAPDCPLLKLESVVFSPHNAAFTDEAAQRVSAACVRNALAAIDGKLDPAFVVNRQVL
ncbi:MAG: NAD(P)-dependent oxidoreductase [Pseudomonadota bacterium]|nr:NAD(P)-dependent oxidoreductase [Pseudomonadota bacterium]